MAGNILDSAYRILAVHEMKTFIEQGSIKGFERFPLQLNAVFLNFKSPSNNPKKYQVYCFKC